MDLYKVDIDYKTNASIKGPVVPERECFPGYALRNQSLKSKRFVRLTFLQERFSLTWLSKKRTEIKTTINKNFFKDSLFTLFFLLTYNY